MKLPTSQYLLPEVPITSDPYSHAGRMVEEAELIWASNSTSWKEETQWFFMWQRQSILVESKVVAGPLSVFGLPVLRATITFNASADELFEFLTSVEGFRVIDPLSDPTSLDHVIKKWDWEYGRLELARTTFGLDDFLVLNWVNPTSRLFCSKSVLHESHPGGSRASSAALRPAQGNRAVNTFALKVTPISDHSSSIQIINFVGEERILKGFLGYIILSQFYFGPFLRRLRASWDSHKLKQVRNEL
eukprot:gene94-101_t